MGVRDGAEWQDDPRHVEQRGPWSDGGAGSRERGQRQAQLGRGGRRVRCYVRLFCLSCCQEMVARAGSCHSVRSSASAPCCGCHSRWQRPGPDVVGAARDSGPMGRHRCRGRAASTEQGWAKVARTHPGMLKRSAASSSTRLPSQVAAVPGNQPTRPAPARRTRSAVMSQFVAQHWLR